MGARFDKVAKGAYKTMKVKTEMSKCTATFDQAEHYDDSPITEAEISALDPRYECRGCSRRFLSMRARTSHEYWCPDIVLRPTWKNLEEENGEWPVRRLLAVRGHPGRRFWKVEWADGSDEAHHGSQGEIDDGSYKHDWVTQKQIENCGELEEEFWKRHRNLNRDASIELQHQDGSDEPRCPHCNKMDFESDAELQTHMEKKCKFIPKKIRKTAPVNEGVQRLRRATQQQAMPDVQVTAEDGT